MLRLNHPNIIRAENYVDVRGRLVTIEEHFEGETLAQYIQQRRHLSFHTFEEVFSQVLGALAYAEERGDLRNWLRHLDHETGDMLLFVRSRYLSQKERDFDRNPQLTEIPQDRYRE